MNTDSYPPPVDKLLTYGPCDDIITYKEWPDYLELGFGPEHIPDLIRLATDSRFGTSNSSDPTFCAPVHAWRTLGQLHAKAAIEPLISMAEDPEYGDIASDELPDVYGLIGVAAISTLTAFMGTQSHTVSAQIDAIACIESIAEMHPDAKEECVHIITHQLELFAENDPEVNAFLILALKNFKALEALPLIKQAFDADRIAQFVVGTWDDVQVAFGVKERTEVLQRGSSLDALFGEGAQSMQEAAEPSKKLRSHSSSPKKNKNKMAKQSRKKNRRRK